MLVVGARPSYSIYDEMLEITSLQGPTHRVCVFLKETKDTLDKEALYRCMASCFEAAHVCLSVCLVVCLFM